MNKLIFVFVLFFSTQFATSHGQIISNLMHDNPLQKDYSRIVLNDSLTTMDGIKLKFSKISYMYDSYSSNKVYVDSFIIAEDQIELISLNGQRYANLKAINGLSTRFIPRIKTGKFDVFNQKKNQSLGSYSTGIVIHYTENEYYYANHETHLKKANYKNLSKDLAPIPLALNYLKECGRITKFQNISYITAAVAFTTGAIMMAVSEEPSYGGALLTVGAIIDLPLTLIIGNNNKKSILVNALLDYDL